MSKRLLVAASLLGASVFLAGCNNTQQAADANANANSAPAVAQTTTRPGPDNSDITTSIDANGVKTETRVFRDNPRVSRVVVTTRNGTRTTRVYARNDQEKEVSGVENALDTTGDAIASAAGFVADKTVEGAKKGVEVGKTAGEKTADTSKKVAGKTVEGAKTVGDKTAEGAKKVGSKTADTAKTVGEKTVEGAKTVGDKTAEGAKKAGAKTAEGAKKAGRAIKRVVTP